MARALIAAVLLVLVLVPAAAAQTGLRDDLAATDVALAGPDVLVARAPANGGVQVYAVPRAGGPARTLLNVSPRRAGWAAELSLAASDERVALIAELRGGADEWRVYTGPPAGPLKLVERTADRGERTWFPYLVDVDGGRVLLVETRYVGSAKVRAALLGEAPIAWTSDTLAPVAIGGAHAAALARRPWRVLVTDLASGAEQATLAARPFEPEMIDLSGDGRLAVQTRAGLVTVRTGEAPRTVPGSKQLTWPLFAGAQLTALDDGRPVVVGEDGSRRVLGAPSRALVGTAADAAGVAWAANGCVRYAPLTGPAAAPPAGDPCPATEIGLYYIADSRLRGRRVRAPVRCVTAPGGVCRGTVLARRGGRLVGRGRFAVPAGTERWVTIRLTRAEARHARRRQGSSLILGARVPDGRIGVGGDGSAELSVKVR